MSNDNVKVYTVTEPWLETNCGLGEAPFWEVSRNSLRFVDIVKEHIYFVDLNEGPKSLKRHDLGFSISTTADIEGNDDEFIFGGKLGYGVYDRRNGKTRWTKHMWNDAERQDDGGGKPGVGKTREARMRSNDGIVDARGRYWVGTMNDPLVVDGNVTDEGVLFRLDPDLSLHRILPGVTIPNGMSWTADNAGFYFTDSPTKQIKVYPYDLETGGVSLDRGKTFFECPYDDGVPDGHCQDAEGHFWIACFGTGKVLRVSPAGDIVARVDLPTRCVSCPVICGKTLYVCSAEEEDPDKYPESVKYQGAVFKVDIGVGPSSLYKFNLQT
ncbi:hypothetical protein AMS68_003505 [Peltaster fructicola]|uniref:SMP-30/Gluconolactonase/LRE-like region domain-containing protein n=1 Tax=Peltaster fructicola TaxID=286661 RepID=A0A6H0XTP9_9PEZI|nr:hypothetical protein AMS68_003505 [Peltaster fructicola]